MYVSDGGGSGGGGGGGSGSDALVDGLDVSASIVISWRLNSSAARLMDDMNRPILRAAAGMFFGPTTMRTTASRTIISAGPTESNPRNAKRQGGVICRGRRSWD